jgi:DivIVA domain-containing protein
MSDPRGPVPGAADKMLTPSHIQQKEFRVSRFGGYKMRDVDEFLDEVTDSLTALTAEVERLRARAGSSPVVGTPDLDDTARQADEIISRAREQAARIVAGAREGSAASTGGAALPQGRAAVAGFLAEEREFLQSLAGLVQRHAETVKEMARTARDRSATSVPEAAGAPVAAGETGAEAGETPAVPPEAATSIGASEEKATVRIPKAEAPVRVEEPSPAIAARPDPAKRPDAESDSLRELFWGEE